MAVRSASVSVRGTYTKTALVEKKVIGFTATVSTNDTIPIGDIPTSPGIGVAQLMKVADGTAVICTVATNIITVTQAALTDVPVVGTCQEK